MAPELVQEFIAAFTEEVNRHRCQVRLERQARQREFAEVARRVECHIEAISDGLRAPGLQARLDELGERKAALEQVIAVAHAPAPRLHPNLAELYCQKVANLRAALADPATRAEALEILRGLVERVTVKAEGEGFTIELVGEIARMVAMASEAKKSRFASASTGAAISSPASRQSRTIPRPRSARCGAGRSNTSCRTETCNAFFSAGTATA